MEIKKKKGEFMVIGCAWHEKEEVNDMADILNLKATHGICKKCKDKILKTLK